MPISQTDLLFKLIKSLTKAEKRNFKLYVNRLQSGGNVKFVKLFDILEKQKKFDEKEIYEKFKGLDSTGFSNLKRHLYSQIMTSLRLINIQKHVDIQIREQIDFAKILYIKGLYIQSLKLLDRIKTLALENHQDYLHVEILEFEKMIQSRHITRTRNINDAVEKLTSSALFRSRVILSLAQITNLKLKLHAFYLNRGHVRNQEEILEIQRIMEDNLPEKAYAEMTFFEKVYLHQSKVWYYYILQQFPPCYKHASRWVELFNENPEMKDVDQNLYMRGMHYLLTSTYNMGFYSRFCETLEEFEAFKEPQASNLKTTSRLISFIYRYTSRLNKHFIEGSFDEGLDLVRRIQRRLQRYKIHLDQHRIMVFYYKIAILYAGAGQPEKAIDFINKILDLDVKHLREDIQCYSRLLYLVAHYEAGNYLLMESLVLSTQRFLKKMQVKEPVQLATLRFFGKMVNANTQEQKDLLQKFHVDLMELKKKPDEFRSFLYLDLTYWTRSKLQNKSIQEVVKQQFQNRISPSGKLRKE